MIKHKGGSEETGICKDISSSYLVALSTKYTKPLHQM